MKGFYIFRNNDSVIFEQIEFVKSCSLIVGKFIKFCPHSFPKYFSVWREYVAKISHRLYFFIQG